MGKKKRDYVVHHKQSLGDQLENPETWGVRVRGWCALLARQWLLVAAALATASLAQSCSGSCSNCLSFWVGAHARGPTSAPAPLQPHPPQTQPRPSKRRRDGEEDEQQEEELVPAAMTARILKQARSQQEEIDAEDAPAGGCQRAVTVAPEIVADNQRVPLQCGAAAAQACTAFHCT